MQYEKQMLKKNALQYFTRLCSSRFIGITVRRRPCKHSMVQLMKVYNCNLIFSSHWFRVSKSQTRICYVVQRRYTSLISNSSKITRQKTTKVVHFFYRNVTHAPAIQYFEYNDFWPWGSKSQTEIFYVVQPTDILHFHLQESNSCTC